MRRLFQILAVILTMSFAVSAYANEIDSDGGTGDTTVVYGVEQTFTLNIPSEVTLQKGEETTGSISVSNVVIPYGETLTVTMSSENYSNGWRLKCGSAALSYDIKADGASLTDGQAVLTVAAGNTAGVSKELSFAVQSEESVAGEYTDTLRFTASVS